MGHKQYALILQSLKYFDRSGLFQSADVNDSVLSSTATKIAAVYDNLAQSLLNRAEGDQQKADYYYNKNYFEYYYNLEQSIKWTDEQNRKIESLSNNNNHGRPG